MSMVGWCRGEWRRRGGGRLAPAALALLAGLVVAVPPWMLPARARQPELTLDEVMLRVSQFVLTFERQFGNRVADESYEQRILSAKGELERSRRYESELLFYRDALHDTWTSYRRITAVDGERTASRWMNPPASPPTLEQFLKQAGRTDEAGMRQFLGPMPWKLHMPLLAMAFVHPLNRYRSWFERTGEEEVRGRHAWTVDFSEHRMPTFVRSRRGNLFANGTFWIVPETGAILRSHLVLGGSVSNRQARTQITVEFEPVGGEELWVPTEMREAYDNPLFPDAPRTEGSAVFSSFRPFVLEREAPVVGAP